MTDLISDVEAARAAYIKAAPYHYAGDVSELGIRAALTAALPMLVRAEREACAKVADEFGKPYSMSTADGAMMFRAVTDKIATAIRSRGEA